MTEILAHTLHGHEEVSAAFLYPFSHSRRFQTFLRLHNISYLQFDILDCLPFRHVTIRNVDIRIHFLDNVILTRNTKQYREEFTEVDQVCHGAKE